MKAWQVLANGALGCHAYVLAFPLHGNGLSKPLDSSLRRNDNGDCDQVFFENNKRVLRIASHLVLHPSSFQRRLESRERSQRNQRTTGFCRRRIVWPPCGGHSRYAGTTCLNHWIPACACLLQAGRNDNGGCGQVFFENDKRVLRIASYLVLYSSSFQRRLESRERSRRNQRTAGFCRRRIVWPPCGVHSRYAEMDYLNHWIPACAGMTRGFDSSLHQNDEGGWDQEFIRNGEGVIGITTHLLSPRCHSSEGSPDCMDVGMSMNDGGG